MKVACLLETDVLTASNDEFGCAYVALDPGGDLDQRLRHVLRLRNIGDVHRNGTRLQGKTVLTWEIVCAVGHLGLLVIYSNMVGNEFQAGRIAYDQSLGLKLVFYSAAAEPAALATPGSSQMAAHKDDFQAAIGGNRSMTNIGAGVTHFAAGTAIATTTVTAASGGSYSLTSLVNSDYNEPRPLGSTTAASVNFLCGSPFYHTASGFGTTLILDLKSPPTDGGTVLLFFLGKVLHGRYFGPLIS